MANPILHHDILLSFYGDDFTGSTDVMETMALNGVPTALFLNVPDAKEIENFRLKVGIGSEDGTNEIRAFGVAGISRSLSPVEMDLELPSIFIKLKQIPTDFFHYKICSTFDSSLTTGNIGHAIELALNQFPSACIPLVVGVPVLGRYVVFGNLYARVDHTTYRLDRHPTMSKHPVTPMNESDLRVHLSRQTDRSISLMDKFALDGAYGNPWEYFSKLIKPNTDFVLFDTLDDQHLKLIGELLVKAHQREALLLVGSSGINYALVLYLQQIGRINKVDNLPKPGTAKNMMVMAGSCAPGTARQINHLKQSGHPGIRIDTLKLVNQIEYGNEVERVIRQVLQCIDQGQIPMVYTALGPTDPAIEITNQKFSEARNRSKRVGQVIAEAQGRMVKEIVGKASNVRVVIAGGDTSGFVSRALDIYALETLYPIAPGAPLCLAHSRQAKFDGLEIALKGGQNGNEKYFESIYRGELI